MCKHPASQGTQGFCLWSLGCEQGSRAGLGPGGSPSGTCPGAVGIAGNQLLALKGPTSSSPGIPVCGKAEQGPQNWKGRAWSMVCPSPRGGVPGRVAHRSPGHWPPWARSVTGVRSHSSKGLRGNPLTFSQREVTALSITEMSTGLKEVHFPVAWVGPSRDSCTCGKQILQLACSCHYHSTPGQGLKVLIY